ncbi:MAG: hypothetical protein BAJATHORv1_160007 [Candidatus Thorarchaeota archaeon]|nr:MAG: hypothetical protein BAJATHORv1_160007 [Candidatus Thorarchaeota archaeon]
MGLLSTHEAIVWWEFQQGKPTGEIASEYEKEQKYPKYVRQILEEKEEATVSFKDVAYVSRVLNRARKKIKKALEDQGKSHRLDIESVQDYKGLLMGFDYQANAQVYIVFTMQLGNVVWYKHDSYAGKLCPDCPKESECRETLDVIIKEYNIELRPDQKQLPMTQQSIAIFTKLAAKENPRYKRST